MPTHCSILTWRIPQTEESGGLQSIGSQRVRHNYSDLACTQEHNFSSPPAQTLNSILLALSFKHWPDISQYLKQNKPNQTQYTNFPPPPHPCHFLSWSPSQWMAPLAPGTQNWVSTQARFLPHPITECSQNSSHSLYPCCPSFFSDPYQLFPKPLYQKRPNWFLVSILSSSNPTSIMLPK